MSYSHCSPAAYHSEVSGFAPMAAVVLELRMDFQNIVDHGMLGRLASTSSHRPNSGTNVRNYGSRGDLSVDDA
jgi:hypothetical protein